MTAVIIILIAALGFFVMSGFLFCGKGKWLIAGYNTASSQERAKYDERKLCRAMGFVCLVCGLMLCGLAFLGYMVDSGMLDENAMLYYAVLSVAVIITTVVLTMNYIDTKAKK